MRSRIQAACLLLAGLAASLPLTGCLIMGYSSRGGGFIFPGGLGLIVMLVVLYLLMRRR